MIEGFKSTEIGELPIDWDVATLMDVSSMKSGLSITSKKIRDDGPFPCYGGNGLRGFTSTYTHEGDYALIGRQGALCGNIQFASNKFFASEHAVVVTPKKNVNIKWLSYVLDRMNLNQYSESSAQPGLSVKKILQLPIPLPPTKAEQTAIATALSDADALITSLERLIAKKKAIKQGAMQELLKPKVGWKVKKLGEIGESIIGLTYSPSNVKENGILVLRSSNIRNNRIVFDDNVYVNAHIPEKLVTKNDDILICVRNGSINLIGKCALISGKAIGESFGAFMSIFRSPYNKFVFHVFQSNYIQRQIEETIGATINQITNKSLNSFSIPFPGEEERIVIANILFDMDAEIALLEKKLEKQKRIKQGMMQVLLTGEVRLL